MTKFIKSRFVTDSGYVTYDNVFIARFKHRGPVTKTRFIKSLVANYTVEDYFAKMHAGRAPLQIFMDDGFLVFDHMNCKMVLDGKVL